MAFKEGDIVKVRQGVLDPDFGGNIGGWQGQVSEVDGDIVCIDWDSITLSNCPDEYIQRCEEDGLDWEQIYLSTGDVEPAIPRITPAVLTGIKEATHIKHQWDHLGEAICKRINEVFEQADGTDEYAMVRAWEQYVTNNLSFPFDAEIITDQDNVPLQQGDKIRVDGIIVTDDHYGVIINLKQGKKCFNFPLCNIRVTDKNSNDYQIVNDYSVWFVNK